MFARYDCVVSISRKDRFSSMPVRIFRKSGFEIPLFNMCYVID